MLFCVYDTHWSLHAEVAGLRLKENHPLTPGARKLHPVLSGTDKKSHVVLSDCRLIGCIGAQGRGELCPDPAGEAYSAQQSLHCCNYIVLHCAVTIASALRLSSQFNAGRSKNIPMHLVTLESLSCLVTQLHVCHGYNWLRRLSDHLLQVLWLFILQLSNNVCYSFIVMLF